MVSSKHMHILEIDLVEGCVCVCVWIIAIEKKCCQYESKETEQLWEKEKGVENKQIQCMYKILKNVKI